MFVQIVYTYQMTINQYIDNINRRYILGNATEHTFRGDLQQLIESLMPDIRATNEPKRQACGAPDYILTRKDIPVGFIEAKDIGDMDLDGNKKSTNKEQFDRYKASLNNLIFTDYINFHLYRDGEFVTKISIGALRQAQGDRYEVVPLPENFASFENLIKDFCLHVGQTIKSPKRLAEMMAGKAKLLSDVIEKSLTSDEDKHEDSTLKDQMLAFKQILISDISPKGFADVYAQTIAYGMFAARLHDPTLQTFSRQEAAELIPKSNPFLRKLFGYIAGPDIDDRIKWIVDSLTDIFLACNVEQILKNYGKQFTSPTGGGQEGVDPIIHFYETFLSEYDPKLRKARGVWYTPAPVVDFIVRAVDDILKTEFDLPQGLADTSKIKVKRQTQNFDKKTGKYTEIEEEVHKVQILDPATGTGTFLAEVVKHIHKKFEGQQGIWSNYVEKHLLPRLNGFELLMASYAMAHLKLDLLLTETGYAPSPSGRVGVGSQRLRVYLTNSLEESHPDSGTLFANWLSTEANEANRIKRDTPVMCVIGNPPYSVSSSNKGAWIQNLIADYKKNLNERKINLDDDYIKFIRYGQHFIDKNESGILAYISNNSFIDGITHRQMRKNLLESFDKAYIIDLHGSSKKNETALDGSKDENVFDIMQGVSINLFVKTGNKKKTELGNVFHFDLFGKREFKYSFLSENDIHDLDFKQLSFEQPYYFFVPKQLSDKKYDSWFSLNDLFMITNNGLQTDRDSLFIDGTKNNIKKRFEILLSGEINKEFIEKYRVVDSSSFKITERIKNKKYDSTNIKEVLYRPFDLQYIYYDPQIVSRPAQKVMSNMLKENLALLCCRQQSTFDFQHILVSKHLSERCTVSLQTKETNYVFPLYLYPETNSQQSIEQTPERTPNLNPEIVNQIADKLGLEFTNEKTSPTPPKEGLSSYPSRSLGGPGYITANPKNYKLIKEMRDSLKDNPTEAEKVMWECLRNKKTEYKIRRQHIIHDFITDFVCLSKKVVIEIDGKIHLQQKEYDELRTAKLNELGYEVIRFTNEEVFANPKLVASKIKEKLDAKSDLQSDEDSNSPPLEGSGEVFAPIDILDYIYAVLHSPTYREKYKEFLKIDFPRVPYPKDAATFWQLVKLGGEIRQIHLLESPVVEQFITQYPVDGDNEVVKPRFVPSPLGKAGVGAVYINETQYFDNVPEVAWNFYIGGYQPAQKWLKDRKGRTIEFDDILHYQKIIVALNETDRIMREIDKVGVE